MKRLLVLVMLVALPAAARNVIVVDNSRPGGAGTFERPFATLAEAQARSAPGDVIYIAEGNAPYEGSIGLRSGQQLIGAAAGLDEPHVAAVQGPGPTIHGNVWMQGDNVVAGCTIVADRGTALSAGSPTGAIVIRDVFLRASQLALSLGGCAAPVTVERGGIQGGGISIIGGNAAIDFDHVAIEAPIAIGRRTAGAVRFRNGGKVDGAVSIASNGGLVSFDVPLRAQGFTVKTAEAVDVTGARSVVIGNVEIRDVKMTASFESISGGDLTVDALHGKLVVAGGDVASARIEQSGAIKLSAMTIGSMFLRHVAHSAFADITMSGGGGIDGHNLDDVAFDRVTISGASGTAIALREIATRVTFTGCTVTDPAGAALAIEQKFANGRVSFDRGEISAAHRANAAPYLIDARTSGSSKLRLGIDSLRLHETSGSAIDVDASGTSALTLDVEQSFVATVDGAFVDATAHPPAKVVVIVRDSHVDVRRPPAVGVEGESCVDLAASVFSGSARLRVRAQAPARVALAGGAEGVEVVAGTSVIPVTGCQ